MINHLRFPACLTVALLATASGCSDTTGVSGDTVTLNTDASSYVAKLVTSGPVVSYQFTIVASLRNSGTVPVQLSRCYPEDARPIFGLATTDPQKSSAYSPGWACVGNYNPIVVAAGETRTDTLTIVTAWEVPTQKPSGEVEGKFRLVYDSGACSGSGGCESRPFTVRLGN